MSDINGINGKNIFDELGVKQNGSTSKADLGQDDFFELMVAQMKNQDPLQPETNGDFLAQLAQFRMSDGITSMQESLDTLTTSLQSNQALQASALVGRTVLVPGNSAQYTGEGAVKGLADISSSARNVFVDVMDQAGQLVKRISMGSQSPGEMTFEWDGMNAQGKQAPSGRYLLNVSGTIGEDVVPFGTYIAGNVDSVTLGNGGQDMKLNVAGYGEIQLSDIKRISE